MSPEVIQLWEELGPAIISFLVANIGTVITTVVGIVIAGIKLFNAIKSNDRKAVQEITANVDVLTEQNKKMAESLAQAQEINSNLMRQLEHERNRRYNVRGRNE